MATLAQVDEVHDRPEGTARRTFNEHKHRLVEGEDFFELDQPDVIRTLGFERPQGGTPSKVILITEQGYSMLVSANFTSAQMALPAETVAQLWMNAG